MKQKRTANKHLFLKTPHGEIQSRFLRLLAHTARSSPGQSPPAKEKLHFNKQVIHVFLGVKNIHVREMKKKTICMWKCRGENRFSYEFSVFLFGSGQKKRNFNSISQILSRARHKHFTPQKTFFIKSFSFFIKTRWRRNNNNFFLLDPRLLFAREEQKREKSFFLFKISLKFLKCELLSERAPSEKKERRKNEKFKPINKRKIRKIFIKILRVRVIECGGIRGKIRKRKK